METTSTLKSEILEARLDPKIVLLRARDVVQQFREYPRIVPQNGKGITLYNPPEEPGVMERFFECLQQELAQQGYKVPIYKSDCSKRDFSNGYTIDVAQFLKIPCKNGRVY